MKMPIVIINKNKVIIFFNGSKIIESINKYKKMSKEEIVKQFLEERGIEFE